MDETVRVYLVERTYSDDEQNIVITTYATPDGEQYYRREQALTSFSGEDPGTPVSMTVDPSNLGTVDPENRETYAAEAGRIAEEYDHDARV
jgi:hypothetical protein